MRKCLKCLQSKAIRDFYWSSLNKCKECVKSDARKAEIKRKSTKEGLEAERARHREKYHRLNYKDKHRPTPEEKKMIMTRYKEKYPEKQKAKNISFGLKPAIPGNQLHHWNYNVSFAKDVIELTVPDHNLLHRHLVYDPEKFIYSDLDGNLLDTKEKHIAFARSLGIKI